MDQDHIDGLLERYLHLLHEYTTLRAELSTLQTGMYQNIARANFAAERGVRFGRDYYDDRMQASRRLAISRKSQDQVEGQDRGRSPVVLSGVVPSFNIVNTASVSVSATGDSEGDVVRVADPRPETRPDTKSESESESVAQSAPEATDAGAAHHPPASSPRADTGDAQAVKDAVGGIVSEDIDSPSRHASLARKGTASSQKSSDPLRWFGLLTPGPLRQAQMQSIRAVGHVIPRLASVDAEMAEVEIEVRRARKKRAKAETAAAAAASKLSLQGSQEQERGRQKDGIATNDACI